MKKLGTAFDQKIKIIQEIQRNFRSPNRRAKNSPNVRQPQPHTLDLPSIGRTNGPYLEIPPHNQQNQHQACMKTQTSPWVQTITFTNDYLTPNEGHLLIQHRNTMRNFAKVVNRPKPQVSEEDIKVQMLTTKRKLIAIDHSRLKEKERAVRIPSFPQSPKIQGTEEKSEIFQEHPRREERTDKLNRYQIMKMKKHELQSLSERNSGLNSSTRMHKESHHPSGQAELNRSSNNQKSRRNRIENSSVSYSPWTSDQSEEINEIWSMQQKKSKKK